MFRPVLLVCDNRDRADVIAQAIDHDVRDPDSLTIVVDDALAGLEVLAERRLALAVVAEPRPSVTISRLRTSAPGLAIVSIVDDLHDVGFALEAGAHTHLLTEAIGPGTVEKAMERALAICAVDHNAPDEETVDSLLGLLAHHLREPIRSARLYNDRAALAGRRTQWHGRIEDALAHADRLATSLLDYLRIDAHEVGPIRIVSLDLAEEELREHYATLGATDANLRWDLAGTAQCQPESLVRILQAVIDNALIFSGTSAPSVDVSSRQVDDHVLITVTDAGPGISSVSRERAFRPLERLSDESPGVGMGLTMARRLAGLADGELSIQPATNGGTTVVLRLRAA